MDPVTVLAKQLQGLSLEVAGLKATVLQQQQQSLGSTVAMGDQGTPEPKVAFPDRFSGGRDQFVTFREACKLFFRLRPRSSGGEEQRVGIVISLLQGDPQAWAFSLPSDSPALRSVEEFFEALGLVYDDPDRVSLAESKLRRLRQENRSAELYCSEFRRWATNTLWNDSALRSQFCQGLSEKLKDALAVYEVPGSLEAAMSLSIRIDRRLRERLLNSTEASIGQGSVCCDPVEPMQIGGATRRVNPPKVRHRSEVCFRCGGRGHFVKVCPSEPKRSQTKEPPEN